MAADDMVSIPRNVAQKIARELRAVARDFVASEPGHSTLLAHADLLEPSLTHDALHAVEGVFDRRLLQWASVNGNLTNETVRAVFAVVREHVELLQRYETRSGSPAGLGLDEFGHWLARADVLRLLGDSDD